MKKLKYFVFLLVALVCVTGCGKDNSKKEIKEAILKLKDTKAISLKGTINMGSDELKMPLVLEFSTTKDGMHMKYGVDVLGTSQDAMEMYTVKKEDGIYTYLMADPNTKTWTYTKQALPNSKTDNDTDVSKKLEEELDEKKIDEWFDTFDSVKKVDSDKEGYQKYELKISKEKMKDNAKKEVDDEENIKKLEESLKVFPDSLVFTIYIKDGELVSFSIDLSEIDFSSLMAESLPTEPTDDPSVNTAIEMYKNMKFFDITIEILGRNDNVKIEVPKEIEEKATEREEIKIEF